MSVTLAVKSKTIMIESENDSWPIECNVDHFIPWSFVMNDELWNLMLMDSSLNSFKSNKLPQWDPFFRNDNK